MNMFSFPLKVAQTSSLIFLAIRLSVHPSVQPLRTYSGSKKTIDIRTDGRTD